MPASASDYASPDVLAEADRAPPRPQPRDVAEEVYEDEEEPLMSQRSDSVGLTQYENVFFAQEECAAACGGGPEVCPPVLPVPAPVAAPVERVSPPADAGTCTPVLITIARHVVASRLLRLFRPSPCSSWMHL